MLFRKTISTIGVMLAAWAVFVGGICLVMLFLITTTISHATPEIPGDSSIESAEQEPASQVRAATDHADDSKTSPQHFKPTRASRAKPSTRI